MFKYFTYLYIFYVQADLFAGAIFLKQAFNWNIYAAIIVLLAIAALFSIAGKWYYYKTDSLNKM